MKEDKIVKKIWSEVLLSLLLCLLGVYFRKLVQGCENDTAAFKQKGFNFYWHTIFIGGGGVKEISPSQPLLHPQI